MENYQTYIDNVNKIRNLSKVVIGESDNKDTIINKIQDNAKKAYEFKVWNDNFLNEFLYNKKTEDLTKEDVDTLVKFVNEVFNYSDSIDSGVAFKLFEKLLDYAKYTNDIDSYIKQLYNTGIALFYLDTKETDDSESLFKDRIASYFIEASSYLDNFKDFNSETRQYIIRSLGNKKIKLSRQTKEQVSNYYKMYDEAYSIMDSKEYRDIDPSLKWDYFKYGMNMDQLSILNYLRKHDDDEYVRNRVLEAAEFVYKRDIHDDETRLLNWRVDYFYHAALYHTGKITIKEMVDEIIRIIRSTDLNDFSMNGMNKNLTAKAYLLYYANLLDDKAKEEIVPLITNGIKDAYSYLDRLPGELYRHTVSEAVRELVDMQAEISNNDRVDMMNYLVAFHKPTYVHSLMVAALTKALTACVLMKKPEYLIGVLDTKTKEDVLSKTEEILDLAYNCGIYHDVGKNMCMSFININERKLIDEEFECIKTHTSQGYELLNKNDESDSYALAALYHHVYYDGTKGYPENLKPCPSFIKPIVDILTIADSTDAATDSIGRHYNKPKTLDALIEEFKQGSGTRYSPAIVDLFEDKTVRDYINNIITNERIIIYLNVYHKGRTYTVSSYLKEK